MYPHEYAQRELNISTEEWDKLSDDDKFALSVWSTEEIKSRGIVFGLLKPRKKKDYTK